MLSAESEAYDAHWSVLAAAVHSAGGHAWRFRNTADPARVIEFMEQDGAADISVVPAIAAALEALEIVAVTKATSTWKEWQSWQG